MIAPALHILLPCHGLEDFPTELGEAEAAGLLNAFSVAFHPAAVAATGRMPAWQRADEPPPVKRGDVVLLPAASADLLPGGWAEVALEAGMRVIEVPADRAELVSLVLSAIFSAEADLAATGDDAAEPLSSADPDPSTPAGELDHDLAADFMALGTAVLQLELLTRRMHYYSNLDTSGLRPELVDAARVATAGDTDNARRKLARCFEILLDARERFFPVQGYLIDLCLVIPRLADKLDATLTPGSEAMNAHGAAAATNYLATAADWDAIAAGHPGVIDAMRAALKAKRAGLVGGELREGPTALLPVESQVWEFDRGLAAFDRLFGARPKIWGRRRYGFSVLLPQLLDRAGFRGGLHVALDDGVYPDQELSKLRWEGCDGVAIDVFSRIPVAADSAVSYLRLSKQIAASMEEDQAAAVMFARWPEVKAPWFDDLRRVSRYEPIFGRFVTLDQFFEETEPPVRTAEYKAAEYNAPYLTQAVARRQPDPVGRFSAAIADRGRLDGVLWMDTVSALLTGRDDPAARRELRDAVENSGPDGDGPAARSTALATAENAAAARLAETLLAGAPAGRGAFLFNPLSFARRTSVAWPEGLPFPAVAGPVKHLQPDRRIVVADLPAGGFAWVACDGREPARSNDPPLAEPGLLRNEFFEVHLSETTGGIAYIKGYGRSPKRLSQQLGYRFRKARTVVRDEWGEDKSFYSEMRCTGLKVTAIGPTVGEAVSTGEIVDGLNGEVLARFTQTVRVTRGRPVIELEITLDPVVLPEPEPWTNYYACRWAWNDSAAALTRSLQGTAQPAGEGRFDAAHYVEIAEGDMRTTILPLATPFHRGTGPRMLDSLLLTAGETARSFAFRIACDEPYPMRAALDALTPAVVVPVNTGPPRTGPAGWFLNVDAKNVVVTHVSPLPSVSPLPPVSPLPGGDAGSAPAGLLVRLQETEGRARIATLNCFRTVTSARIVDLGGGQVSELHPSPDGVKIDVHRYELVTVELRF